MQLTRRRFLTSALTTTAACHSALSTSSKGGLARAIRAAELTAPPSAVEPLIDTHTYIGQWPHARLPGDDSSDLIAMLRRNQVSQAWTGSFDGLLHKDIAAVNHRLADVCAQQGHGLLTPFGAANPTLPDWEDDIRRCHESFHMPGIRLHPTYHGYTLDEPRFARLLQLAADRGFIVQLVAWLDDAHHKWLMPNATAVDLTPLVKLVAKLPNLRLVISGGVRSADDEAVHNLAPLKQLYFDFARLDSAAQLTKLVAGLSAKRIVFGSRASLHSIDSMRTKLQNAQLSSDQRTKIASGTAAQCVQRRH